MYTLYTSRPGIHDNVTYGNISRMANKMFHLVYLYLLFMLYLQAS